MKCVRVAILGVCLVGACFGGELKFDEKKFAKTIWEEGHESGYTEGRESILEILDAINRGNDTVEKLTALGYDAKTAQEVLEKK